MKLQKTPCGCEENLNILIEEKQHSKKSLQKAEKRWKKSIQEWKSNCDKIRERTVVARIGKCELNNSTNYRFES